MNRIVDLTSRDTTIYDIDNRVSYLDDSSNWICVISRDLHQLYNHFLGLF